MALDCSQNLVHDFHQQHHSTVMPPTTPPTTSELQQQKQSSFSNRIKRRMSTQEPPLDNETTEQEDSLRMLTPKSSGGGAHFFFVDDSDFTFGDGTDDQSPSVKKRRKTLSPPPLMPRKLTLDDESLSMMMKAEFPPTIMPSDQNSMSFTKQDSFSSISSSFLSLPPLTPRGSEQHQQWPSPSPWLTPPPPPSPSHCFRLRQRTRSETLEDISVSLSGLYLPPSSPSLRRQRFVSYDNKDENDAIMTRNDDVNDTLDDFDMDLLLQLPIDLSNRGGQSRHDDRMDD